MGILVQARCWTFRRWKIFTSSSCFWTRRQLSRHIHFGEWLVPSSELDTWFHRSQEVFTSEWKAQWRKQWFEGSVTEGRSCRFRRQLPTVVEFASEFWISILNLDTYMSEERDRQPTSKSKFSLLPLIAECHWLAWPPPLFETGRSPKARNYG